MKKIYIKRALIIFFIAGVLFYGWYFFPPADTEFEIDDHVTECEALIPEVWSREKELAGMEKTLDFSMKQNLCKEKTPWGGKYGFRKKLVLDKTTVIELKIWEDLQYKHYFYGIYKDEALKQPVKELSMEDVLEWNTDAEMGIFREKYKNFSEVIREALEPGTYYLGIYTTEPKDEHKIRFVLWKSVVNTEISLTERKLRNILS